MAFDPPQTPDTIAAARADRARVRAELGYPPDADDLQPANPYDPPSVADWERAEAYQGLERLIQKLGAKRVMSMVRNLAALLGQECE